MGTVPGEPASEAPRGGGEAVSRPAERYRRGAGGSSRGPRALILVLLALNLALGGALVVLRTVAWPLAERVARDRLAGAVGSGQYVARISLTSWWDLMCGRVGLLEITGDNVRLSNGLPVAHFTATIWNLESHHDTIVKIGSVNWAVRVIQGDLNDYLRGRSNDRLRPVPTVTLLQGAMEVSARDGVPGAGLPEHIRGRVEIADGTRVNFALPRASVDDAPVAGPTALMLSQVNPVLNAGELPYGLTIRSLDIHEGEIEVAGTAAPSLPFSLRP